MGRAGIGSAISGCGSSSATRMDQTRWDDPIQASISARVGGTAPVRVQVIAEAVTAYVTTS